MDMQDFLFEKLFAGPRAAELYTDAAGCGFVTGAQRSALPALQPPETNSGFLPAWWYGAQPLTRVEATADGCRTAPAAALPAQALRDRRLPLWYKAQVPQRGAYLVTLTLRATAEEPEALLFLGRRRLVWRGALQAGECRTLRALTEVSPIVARGQTAPIEDTSVDVTLVGALSLCRLRIEPAACRMIYIMGDSTVTDQSADVPYAPGTSYCGWGQMLPACLPGGVCVSNHAHSGLTTESFRTEGHYAVLRPLLRPGDLCLMQFGHNDQKLPHLKAYEGYTRRLRDYIAELRALGATPVLVTPLARNSWCADDQYNDLLAEYAAACHDLGRETDTPVIDLHAASMADITGVGRETAKQWFYPGDYTHTNDFGAYRMACHVFEGLCGLKLLPGALPPAPWAAHPPLQAAQPPAGCTVPLPEGLGDAYPDYDTDAPLTRVGALELVIRAMHLFPINVYNDLYRDVLGHETYAGTVQCAAQNALIPPVLTTDGCLYPARPITLEEFVTVLMPAYAGRRTLGGTARTPAGVAPVAENAARLAVGEGLLPPDANWAAPLTRRQGAALCRQVRI